MNERLKELRKTIGLTLSQFGERLGVSKSAASLWESGGRNLSDSTIKLICKEFYVNEEWLRTGEGDMFVSDTSKILDDMVAAHGLGHEQRIMLEKFVRLKPEVQQALLNYVMEVADTIKEYREVTDSSEMSAEDLHAELDRHIALEKEAAEKSGVS